MEEVFSKVCNRCGIKKDWTEYTFRKSCGKIRTICRDCCRRQTQTKELAILRKNAPEPEFRQMGHNMAMAKRRK